MVFCKECGRRIEMKKSYDQAHLCKICESEDEEDDVVDKLASGNFFQENYDSWGSSAIDWSHLD